MHRLASIGLHRLLASLLVGLLLSACGTPDRQTPEGGVPAASNACRDALRDVTTWCSGGLRETDAGFRYNCLDARLRLDRSCYPG